MTLTKEGMIAMSFYGIARGLWATVEGILEADPEKALGGVVRTAAGAVGVAVTHLIHEDTGQVISDYSESDA
jgi:hypothetical protein